jgi:cobaltochelatase CobS
MLFQIISLLKEFNMSITTAAGVPTTVSLDEFVASAMNKYATAPAPYFEPSEGAEPVAPVAPLVLKSGEEAYGKLFGGVPKNMRDFAVRKFSDVSEEMLHLIPKTDDKYVVQKEECARIVAAIMDNEKILVTGPTGSGKSSLIKYVCSLLGAPFIRINMSADAESSVLFGQLVVREGATVWEDGPITEAVRYGGVVLIDEWELMPPEISMGLQNLLEDDGYLFLKEKPGSAADKTFVPHKNFRLICAGNTVGQGDESGGFSGTMVQNSATLDRFTTTVCLDYLSKPHEMSIIRGKTKVSKPTAENMIKLASLIRSAYNQQQINLTMSPRTLLSWGNKIVRHDGNVWFAFTIAFYDKLRDSDKKVVKELFDKVHAV